MILWLLRIGLNIFAGGRSMTKILIFFIGAVVVFLMNKLLKTRAHAAKLLKWEKVSRFLFVGTLTLIFILSLFGTLFLFRSFGADWGKMLIATSDTSYSGSRFLHSHIMKPAFAFIAEAVPSVIPKIEKVTDIGTSYLRVMPWFWGPMSAFLFLLLLISGIFLSTSFISRHKGRFGVIILFGVAIIATMKNAFDGGILSHEVIPSITVLFLLLRGEQSIKRALIIPALLHEFAIVCFVAGYFTHAVSWSDFGQYFIYLFGLDCIYLSWFYICEKGKHKSRAVIGLIVGAICLFPIALWDFTGYLYSNFAPSDVVYVSTYSESDAEQVDSIGNLNVYKINNSERKTVADLVDFSGDSTMYMPVAPCRDIKKLSTYVSGLISKDSLVKGEIKHNLIQASFDFIGEKNGWYKYSAIRTASVCLPRPINAFSEMIKEAGGRDSIIIVPFESANHYPNLWIFRSR